MIFKDHKIAIVQMKSENRKKENLINSLNYIEYASRKKAEIIFFPEFQMLYSDENQGMQELSNEAESINNGIFIKKLKKSAKDNNIEILATLFEKNDDENNKRVFDTAVYINKSGKIIAKYQKVHLYDALGFKESNKMISGNKIEKPINTKLGKTGIMICYDVRFPEMSRILTLNGAEILAVPSGWVSGIMKEEHWKTMLTARALENGTYVIAPDQVGNIFCGRSMIIDPFGSVLLDMGNRQDIEIIDLQMNRVEEVRKSLPLLKNRRNDVYKKNSEILFDVDIR